VVDVKNILIDPMEQKEEKKEEGKRGFGERRPQQQRRPQEKREREEEAWIPITKLGRLVKGGYITSIEEIYKFALQVKGDHFPCNFVRTPNR
jgi:small subunit ribosomal protein S2e